MRHWFWCRVTRNNGEPDTNKERVAAVCKAHGLGIDIKMSHNDGTYLILMPEFPESIEIMALEIGVGELTVTMQ